MKRFWMITVVLLLIFALFGCAEQESVYTVNKNGVMFQVDTEQKTISDALNTYQYELSGDTSSFSITITYPDGATYWYTQSEGMGQGGWSDDYNESAYVSGDTLVTVMQENMPKRVNFGKIAGGLILIVIGILDVVSPKTLWYLGYGWRYKNAEPSEAAISFGRVSGAIAIVIGIIFMLV